MVKLKFQGVSQFKFKNIYTCIGEYSAVSHVAKHFNSVKFNDDVLIFF